MMQKALDYSIFGNFLIDYLASLALFIVGALLVFVFKKYVLSRLRAWSATTETSLDDLLVVAASKAIPILYTGVFFLSMHVLNFSATFEKVLENTIIILVTVFAVRALISTPVSTCRICPRPPFSSTYCASCRTRADNL